jgi:hypothetical protein
MPLIDSGAALFAGSSVEFAEMAPASRLTAHLTTAFRSRWGKVSDSEIRSWKHSLTALAGVVTRAGLDRTGAGVELKLPRSERRVDAFFVGRSTEDQPSVVLVEVKQWETAGPSIYPDNVVIGGVQKLHPSVQVSAYADHLRDSHSAFTEEGFELRACAYLHNMDPSNAALLKGLAYEGAIREAAFYVEGDEDRLAGFLQSAVGRGDGMPLLQQVVHGRYRPSLKLLDAIKSALQTSPAWTLLDEQRLAFNIVRGMVERVAGKPQKGAVIVLGGPGTGKSVIAAHLLIKLSQDGGYAAAHATGSKAFTTNLRALVKGRGDSVFRYFNNFREHDTEENELDVLICDEAHRIRATSNDQWTPKAKKSEISQAEELLRAARVSVFFLDQRQNVRPGEIGSVGAIEDAAKRLGVRVETIKLEAQFRCNGCGAYIEWVDRLFSDRPEPPGGWLSAGDYELRSMETPDILEKSVRARVSEGVTGRLVAGFCWPWSDPAADGSLAADVVIGDWSRPWNEKSPEQFKKAGSPPRADRHPYYLWATRPERFAEIGCIYSAQGFEFDYCGVILGNDLVWREGAGWLASRDASCDSVIARRKLPQSELLSLLQQTYRVLLTRGMQGTYIYSVDFETRRMLERLIGGAPSPSG